MVVTQPGLCNAQPVMVSRLRPRRFGIAACLTIAVAAFGATTALAAPIESQVEVLTIDQVGPDDVTVVYGVVTSDSRKCLSGRKVQAIAVRPTGDVKFDTGRTGTGGGWEARDTEGALEGADLLKLKLVKKTVKQGGKTVRCSGEKIDLT